MIRPAHLSAFRNFFISAYMGCTSMTFNIGGLYSYKALLAGMWIHSNEYNRLTILLGAQIFFFPIGHRRESYVMTEGPTTRRKFL